MANAASLHRAMFQAVQDRDLGKLRSLYSPDYVYTGGDGVENKGPDAGVAVADMYLTAFPDVVLTITHQYEVSPDVSVIEFTARGTHTAELAGVPATGKRIEVVVCNVVETYDGKIVREREYFDSMTLMKQLGVID